MLIEDQKNLRELFGRKVGRLLFGKSVHFSEFVLRLLVGPTRGFYGSKRPRKTSSLGS